MRIAVIERFSTPSRNCDPNVLTAAGHAVHCICLRRGHAAAEVGTYRDKLRRAWREAIRVPRLVRDCLRSLAGILSDRQLSRRDKSGLIASALATRGAPFSALAGAHSTVRLLRSARFDRIDCFAARGFALVPFLSRLLGIPWREHLEDSTRYFGEFAFELMAVVPYAYWLHRQGRLQRTAGCADTRCLYYFSPAHQECAVRRSYVPVTEYPSARRSRLFFDVWGFPEQLDTARWEPPPYRAIYHTPALRWSKELCIVCNKYTPEPSVRFHRAINYLPVPVILELLALLTLRYQVVYVRPREEDIVGDHQAIRDLGDLEAIRDRFPEVLTIQQLHAGYPEFSFNELQLRAFASCERFISVLGGSSFLASYFGGTNIVYAREGWEVSCDAYGRWFQLFSGAKVLRAATYRQLRELVRREFLS